jgi:hypothetical protein
MLLKGLKQVSVIIRHPALPLTLGLVGWFEAVFTIEWSFPYCSSLEDGPASAVFGMPLPYIRWSGVSSMEYFYMPSILIVNILILFAIAFPFVYWAVKKVAAPEQRTRRRMLSFAGLILLLSISAWTFHLVRSGVYKIPVSTVASDYETYSEFRPIRFTFKDLHYDCTPSNYWFGDGWRPRAEKAAGTNR